MSILRSKSAIFNVFRIFLALSGPESTQKTQELCIFRRNWTKSWKIWLWELWRLALNGENSEKQRILDIFIQETDEKRTFWTFLK